MIRGQNPGVEGERFGRLVVIYDPGGYRRRHVECHCDCGATHEPLVTDLRRGGTRSCGCLNLERARKHGHTAQGLTSFTYNSWSAMMQRCYNPSNPKYPNYGGRGIVVCVQWRVFAGFLADMGVRPLGRSLDRINNEGDYEPGNCRWATPKEQANNRRPRRPREIRVHASQ